MTNFRKSQAEKRQKNLVPKLINKETINKDLNSSLFDKQRDILMHA